MKPIDNSRFAFMKNYNHVLEYSIVGFVYIVPRIKSCSKISNFLTTFFFSVAVHSFAVWAWAQHNWLLFFFCFVSAKIYYCPNKNIQQLCSYFINYFATTSTKKKKKCAWTKTIEQHNIIKCFSSHNCAIDFFGFFFYLLIWWLQQSKFYAKCRTFIECCFGYKFSMLNNNVFFFFVQKYFHKGYGDPTGIFRMMVKFLLSLKLKFSKCSASYA